MIGCALTSPAAAPDAPKPAPWSAQAQPPAAAPAPPPAPASGGIPGMPQVGMDALKKIQEDGVLGSIIVVLFLIIGTMGWVIWKREGNTDKALQARDLAHAAALKLRDDSIEKTREEWESQVAELHESRLSLFREVMTALGASTAVLTMNSQSIDQRTVSAEKLRDSILELIATSAASRAQFLALAAELARQGANNTESLQRISYKMPGGGA